MGMDSEWKSRNWGQMGEEGKRIIAGDGASREKGNVQDGIVAITGWKFYETAKLAMGRTGVRCGSAGERLREATRAGTAGRAGACRY